MGREGTERKWADEVRQQRDFYETLLEAQSDVGEGLLLVEGERIRYANKAFYLMSGYSAEELTALSSYLELAAGTNGPCWNAGCAGEALIMWLQRTERTLIDSA